MNILCSGPGPHVPANGVLGQSTVQVTGMRCQSPQCDPSLDPAAIAAAANDANAVTTRTALSVGMARLTAIINQGNTLAAQSTAWTVAQQKAVAQAIADLALIDRRLIREALDLRDAPD